MHRRYKRTRIPKGDSRYRQIWRVVDGAVADALKMHPDYLTSKGSWAARESIVKRVTGAITGYEAQASRGRSVEETAAETA